VQGTKPANFAEWDKTADAFIILELRIRSAALHALRCLVHVYRDSMTAAAAQWSPALKPTVTFCIHTFQMLKKLPQATPTKPISMYEMLFLCCCYAVVSDVRCCADRVRR
jgi:hypothetical protein